MNDVNAGASDEISLLDIAVVIAENWLLLVLAPLIAGAIAFGVLYSMTPRLYDSEALLRIDANEAAFLQSARVLNGALVGSSYLEEYEGSLSRARQELVSESLNVSAEPDTNLYRVRITVDSAEGASDLLQRIIASLIENSAPTSSESRLLEIQLQQAQSSIRQLESSLERLNQLSQSSLDQGASSSSSGDIGQSIVTLVTSIEQRYSDVFRLQEQLAGTVSTQDVIQEPTTPDSPRPRGLLTRVILVVLGVGFVALIAAFIRSGLQAASHDARQIDKVNRIRRAFWLKPVGPAA